MYDPTREVLTEPEVYPSIEPVFPLLSVHSAPASIQDVLTSTVSVPVFVVTIGAVVSTTVTILDAEPVLKLESTFSYTRIYVPTKLVFTLPERVNVPSRMDHEPSTSSIQDAPSSVYGVPTSKVMFALPERVTTGEVVSGKSKTTTVRVMLPVFPAEST